MESFPPSTLGFFGQTDKDVNVQPVHSGGLTRVVYAPEKSNNQAKYIHRLFTAGDDYLVRILPSQIDEQFDSLTIDDALKSITWIDADADYLVSAAEDGCVRIYQHTTPQVDDLHAQTSPTDLVCILSRSLLAARCAALERRVQRGKTPRVAVCTDELVVKVIDAGDPKHVQLLTGHERSIRAASWSPNEALLATSSCDGSVKLWNLSSTEPKCIQTLANILSPSKSDSELTAEVTWHPSGQYFVVPGKTHEALTFEYGVEWKATGSLVAMDEDEIRAPTGDISAMAFCSNGRYLAVSTSDGQITIWDWSSRKPLRSKKSTSLITAISWHPSLDTLSWADNSGQLCRWSNVVGSTMPSPFEKIDYSSLQKSSFGKDADELDEFDDAFDEGDMDVELGLEERDNARRRDSRRSQGGAVSGRRMRQSHDERATPSQPSFQPSATSMSNKRRFLCFNTIGSLLAIDQDTHQSISFESFDAGARRNWRFVDETKIDMASIGVTGALMACPERKGLGQDDDDDNDEEDDVDEKDKGYPSTITFKPFEVPGAGSLPGSEWSVALPRGEAAVSLTMAGRRSNRNVSLDSCMAVVATTAGYLRFFSGGGLQRYIWAFGSQIVTLAAGNRFLLVIHRNSPASDGHQNLMYTLIDISTMDIRQEGTLPIVKGATIVWAGFGEMDVPGVFDSQGVLLLLDRTLASKGQARWIPALDTRTIVAKDGSTGGASSSKIKYWPVGLDSAGLLAVMLKGRNVPDASSPSRPLIQDLPFSMPGVIMKDATGAMEEQALRQSQLASFARAFRSSLHNMEEQDEYYADILEQPAAKSRLFEHEADKALLQVIHAASKRNEQQRVLDAARELHTTRTLDAAQQIPSFFKLSSLADRVGALRDWVSDRRERDERKEVAHDAASYAYETAQPTSTSRVLVAGSPGPAAAEWQGGNARSKAKAALGRDFDSQLPSRTYGGARSELAKFGQTPGGGTFSSGKTARGVSSGTSADRTPYGQEFDEGEEEEGEDMDDSQMHETHGSPVVLRSSTGKRRSQERDEGVNEAGQSAFDSPAQKKTRESNIASSPFGNKTNKDFARPDATSTTTTTTAKNPFARTAAAGLTRDRSMHKSTSFFDRVDNASPSTAVAAGGANLKQKQGLPKKTKQTTLFGMTSAGGSTSSSRSVADAAPFAATPVFGETDEETQQTNTTEDQGSDESMRLTLTAAQQRERQSQVRLEETQYNAEQNNDDEMLDKDDEESQTFALAPVSLVA